eukprot:jgi/Galph1/2650/GphlegSOOS_G1322.1
MSGNNPQQQALLERIQVISTKVNQVLAQIEKDLEVWDNYGKELVEVNQVFHNYTRKLKISLS